MDCPRIWLLYYICVQLYGPLPPDGKPTAVNKYHIISYRIVSHTLTESYTAHTLVTGGGSLVFRILTGLSWQFGNTESACFSGVAAILQ